jgi:hypothetical protein
VARNAASDDRATLDMLEAPFWVAVSTLVRGRTLYSQALTGPRSFGGSSILNFVPTSANLAHQTVGERRTNAGPVNNRA